MDNVHNLSPDLKELIDRTKLKSLFSVYSTLMQHQHTQTNAYLDSQQQQTLRPPSYNSLTNSSLINPLLHPQALIDPVSSTPGKYQNGNGHAFNSIIPSPLPLTPSQGNVESSEVLQDVISLLQQNVSQSIIVYVNSHSVFSCSH